MDPQEEEEAEAVVEAEEEVGAVCLPVEVLEAFLLVVCPNFVLLVIADLEVEVELVLQSFHLEEVSHQLDQVQNHHHLLEAQSHLSHPKTLNLHHHQEDSNLPHQEIFQGQVISLLHLTTGQEAVVCLHHHQCVTRLIQRLLRDLPRHQNQVRHRRPQRGVINHQHLHPVEEAFRLHHQEEARNLRHRLGDHQHVQDHHLHHHPQQGQTCHHHLPQVEVVGHHHRPQEVVLRRLHLVTVGGVYHHHHLEDQDLPPTRHLPFQIVEGHLHAVLHRHHHLTRECQ